MLFGNLPERHTNKGGNEIGLSWNDWSLILFVEDDNLNFTTIIILTSSSESSNYYGTASTEHTKTLLFKDDTLDVLY